MELRELAKRTGKTIEELEEIVRKQKEIAFKEESRRLTVLCVLNAITLIISIIVLCFKLLS